MTTLPTLTPFLNELHKTSRLRVWSIVVTIFGDLVQPRATPISTQELLQLTSAIGIEGNALRTVMSRLAKEGWLTRHKQGRTSAYSLSKSGANTFLAASERIYKPNFLPFTARQLIQKQSIMQRHSKSTKPHASAKNLSLAKSVSPLK